MHVLIAASPLSTNERTSDALDMQEGGITMMGAHGSDGLDEECESDDPDLVDDMAGALPPIAQGGWEDARPRRGSDARIVALIESVREQWAAMDEEERAFLAYCIQRLTAIDVQEPDAQGA